MPRDISNDNPEIPGEIEITDEEELSADKLKKLREKLKACESQKQEYLDGWQRARADLVNARKQDEVAKQEFAVYAKEAVIADILPALESFELALSDKEGWKKLPQNWTKGIEHIHSQLSEALRRNGLAIIDPVGEKFDPMRHDAVGEEPTDDQKLDHTVSSVKQKGFSLHNKIIRPARVIVKSYQHLK